MIKLNAGNIKLTKYDKDSNFYIKTLSECSDLSEIVITGSDSLYALQYLVNRAIQKLEEGKS